MIADVSFLERLIGPEAVETLVSVAGGLVLRIPKRPPLDGPLADLPMPAQEALTAWAGGDRIYIPKCDGAARARRDRTIIALYDAGVSVKDIARRYHLTERWVYEIIGRQPTSQQPSLF